jgi:type I restriction enzyme, S subunit
MDRAISDLPEGWAYAKLPQIAAINMGQSPPGSTYNKQGDGLPFFQGKADFGDRSPTVRVWCTSPKKIARPGDVLISVRAPVGPTNVADRTCGIGRGLAAVTSLGGILPEFVLFALRLQESELETKGVGSTFTAVNKTDLEEIEVPVPPLAEQKRIVAKIEDLLARVNATRERLAKVPAILKRFRQAVLAAACSGRLTEDYRNGPGFSDSAQDLLASISSKRRLAVNNKKSESYKEPLQPDVTLAPEKPDEWVLSSIDQLSCLVTSGSRGWAKYYSTSGPVFVRAQDINTDKLILDDVAHVNLPSKAEGQRTRICLKDLLVTITGANVTKSAVVTSDIGEAYVSQHVALVRPVDPSIAEYLYLWLLSPMHGRAKLLNDAYGAGKPGLNLDDIKEILVSLPSFSEQEEIVRRVEALFKLAETIEKRVAAGTGMAERLTQAILTKAFCGELVPTEADLARVEGRSYEPAYELLARIKAIKNSSRFKMVQQETTFFTSG